MAWNRAAWLSIRALGGEQERLGGDSRAATGALIRHRTLFAALTLLVVPMLAAKLSAAEPKSARELLGHRSHQEQAASNSQSRSRGFFQSSASKQRREAVDSLPLDRLTASAQKRILRVVESPTLYRKLPTQSIPCDRDMFLFLARNPEVLVGMWDLMGVTDVDIRRTSRYKLEADDGSGTTCTVDLVYGDSETHVFVANGSYDGRFAARPIRGAGVFVLHSRYERDPAGGTTVTGVLDCFIKLDGFGADLVARTLGGLIGSSADNNFVETARFISQVSLASENDPSKMVEIARQLPQVQLAIKKQFAGTIVTVAKRALPPIRDGEASSRTLRTASGAERATMPTGRLPR